MLYILILFPLVMAAATFTLPFDRHRPWLLPLGALGHLALVVSVRVLGPEIAPLSRGWEAGCSSILLASSSSGF